MLSKKIQNAIILSIFCKVSVKIRNCKSEKKHVDVSNFTENVHVHKKKRANVGMEILKKSTVFNGRINLTQFKS